MQLAPGILIFVVLALRLRQHPLQELLEVKSRDELAVHSVLFRVDLVLVIRTLGLKVIGDVATCAFS